MRRICIVLFLVAAASHAWAQQAPSPLRVALAGAPPFVIEADGAPVGFAADLWQGVAIDNGWKFEYRAFATMEAALSAVAAGECDVLVGNRSEERRVGKVYGLV